MLRPISFYVPFRWIFRHWGPWMQSTPMWHQICITIVGFIWYGPSFAYEAFGGNRNTNLIDSFQCLVLVTDGFVNKLTTWQSSFQCQWEMVDVLHLNGFFNSIRPIWNNSENIQNHENTKNPLNPENSNNPDNPENRINRKNWEKIKILKIVKTSRSWKSWKSWKNNIISKNPENHKKIVKIVNNKNSKNPENPENRKNPENPENPNHGKNHQN